MATVAGFLVYEVTGDTAVKDLLYKRRVIYETWETAVAEAGKLAQKVAERWSSAALCILRAGSENACIKDGYCTAFRIAEAESEIMIFPVCRPAGICN